MGKCCVSKCVRDKDTHTVAARRELRACDFAAQALQNQGVLDGVAPLLFARGRERKGKELILA